MWPGDVIAAGTAWHAAHGGGADSRERAWRCAWCAPTPSAVVNVLPARSTGGAGDAAVPWQPSQPVVRPTWSAPSTCGADGWQVAQSLRAWLGGGLAWQRMQPPAGAGSSQRG